MQRRILSLFSITAMLAILMLSCTSSKTPNQKSALLQTVKRYDSQLRLAYLESNLNHMKQVATKKHIGELFPTFQSLRIEDSYMRAELKLFEVEGVRLTGKGKGQVDTKEKWVFWWQSHKTNKITKPKKEVNDHMRYDLVVEDGLWKVDKLEDLDPDE